MSTHQTTRQGTPALAKIALGDRISGARQRAGLSRAQLAEALGVGDETVRRWEIGESVPKQYAVKALAEVLDIPPAEFARMTTLVLDAKGRGLFEGNTVAPNLRLFYESEATAVRIRSIGLESLPGLLQTRAYQRANQDAQLPIDDERAAGLRELRTRRQEINFGRHPLPKMEFVIGRAALSYLDDYPDLRDEQIARIREVDAMPQVGVRVVSGFHAAMPGSFTILTPPAENGVRPFVYVEAIDGGRYIEGNVVSEYEAAFEKVSASQSVTIEEVLG